MKLEVLELTEEERAGLLKIVEKGRDWRMRHRAQTPLYFGDTSSTLLVRKWLIPLETQVKPQTTKQAWRGLMGSAVSTPGPQTATFGRA